MDFDSVIIWSIEWFTMLEIIIYLLFSPALRAMASSFTRFLDHTQRRTTIGRIPLDEWSALRRDLYLTTHNTHHRKNSMLMMGFKPTIAAATARIGTMSEMQTEILITFHYKITSYTTREVSIRFRHLLLCKTLHTQITSIFSKILFNITF
jgi:hypothetical protein